MQRQAFLLFVTVLALLRPVKATSWDDVVNNLSTDLAPVIALFGEQVTKQWLSEFLTAWDSIIFAMGPLGIITAIVSAIRVAGSPSLKAFIGRAQEPSGIAELELLSCTSKSTAEFWSGGGIARIFGRPKILEVVRRVERTIPCGSRSQTSMMLLLGKGANADLVDQAGETPLEAAIHSGSTEIVQIILPYVGVNSFRGNIKDVMAAAKGVWNQDIFPMVEDHKNQLLSTND